jgi:phosphatidylserine/phosphatidylglycerophosphate/cardiolipin synthase-like enzyme
VLAALAPAATALPAGSYTKAFAPRTFHAQMRVRPVLTPDPGVYVEAVHALVAGAQTTLYVQTQYAHPSPKAGDAAFMDLLAAVAERQQAGVDVRLIFSQWQTQPYLEKLQAAGIDLSGVRIQQGVHNKGIVVDRRTVLVSSQNWSADAVLRNRDAGLIIEHPPIARYFQQLFLHDWTTLAHQQALEG